ncbi:spore germination protein KB [Paenibacillus tianmuensis]|uniref:Spore germination protein KB n=1 Tax=Paenibacillus tianmuensis TaxID=624147 RepID=A0A1G4QA60_9BACL|nr:endospore germination permease [Paenibacillus tianmuensis]SCW41218.1 spore germination protein KB [Paenibacillus tianmuensis]
MFENDKIETHQFTLLVILFVVGDALLYVPSWLASSAKQDAWLAAGIGCVEGLAIAWLYTTLAKRHFPATLIDLCRSVFGRWAGTVAACFFVSFILVDISIMLFEIGDFITTQMMPETPIEVVILLFTGVIVLGVRQGAVALVRSSEMAFPLFVLLYLMLVLFISPQIKLEHAQPVLSEGLKPILEGNLRFFGNLEESVILLMLFPLIRNPSKGAKAYATGLAVGTMMLTVFSTVSILVMGSDMTALLAYPSYVLAQKVAVGKLLERIEAIMAFIWFISVFVKISVCYYAASYGIAQIVKLPKYRPVTLPLAMISVVLALVFVPNRPYFDHFATKFWTPYMLTFGLFLPLLMLGAAWMRRSPGKR